MSELRTKQAQAGATPLEVLERMLSALNQHDLDEMVACFSRDYQSEQPFHPERNFIGQAGVRKNWGHFFSTIPDIQADVLSETTDGDTIWAELHIHGVRTDGKTHTTRGVTLQRIRDGLIVWARLYIETPSGANGERAA